MFQLSFDNELLEKFWFLKRIISPILETYYVAACRLTLLQQGEMPGIVKKLLLKFCACFVIFKHSFGMSVCLISYAFLTIIPHCFYSIFCTFVVCGMIVAFNNLSTCDQPTRVVPDQRPLNGRCYCDHFTKYSVVCCNEIHLNFYFFSLHVGLFWNKRECRRRRLVDVGTSVMVIGQWHTRLKWFGLVEQSVIRVWVNVELW